ncbi:MAG: hypothetical protein K0R52_931, partial [Alphaproteobacteria bacterium]|nr:hypothetical protein [Alphaproteobacteria bacterium]
RLGALLTELIEDPAQRAALSKGALTLPDRFSEARVLKLWDDVLAEVVKKRLRDMPTDGFMVGK